MIKIEAKVEGAKEAQEKIEKVQDAIPKALFMIAEELRQRAIDLSPSDTGHFKRSWGQIDQHEGGLTFENPVEYGSILEEGLYPGVGRRTVQAEGGIFSRQAVGGILGPMTADDDVVGAIEEIFQSVLEAVIEKE